MFCAWQWRLEHSGSNWNACRSAPISAGALYGSKFLLAVFVSALAQGCIGGLYVLGGRLAGLTGPVPAELVSWLLGGFVGVWGAVSRGLASKDETRGGAQIAGAISTIAGGAIIIAAAVCFGQLDASWMPN